MSRDLSHDDVVHAKERYRTSRDPIYLALAIGNRPHDPPQWVMLEAIRLADQAEGAAISGNSRLSDGEILDDVIRAYFAHEDQARSREGFSFPTYRAPSFKKVLQSVLVSRGFDPNTSEYEARARTISRQWKTETNGIDDRDEMIGIPRTHRYNRMLLEWGDRETERPYSQISKILYLMSLVE